MSKTVSVARPAKRAPKAAMGPEETAVIARAIEVIGDKGSFARFPSA